MIDPITQLYPALEPYATHQLEVGDGHTLYVEESGNPAGLPVLVLHGGPGSGCKPNHRQRFNPSKWRIVCFDQRGCGQSTPPKEGPLHANTTPHLVADCERIREHLGVGQWSCVSGSSWGSTLTLAYSQRYPHNVRSLMISAIFLGTHEEIEWFDRPDGLGWFLPEEYRRIKSLCQGIEGATLSQKAAKVLAGPDRAQAQTMAEAYTLYECLAMELAPDRQAVEAEFNDPGLISSAQIELHYFAHLCFMEDKQLIKNVHKISHLPITILHGNLDLVCPPAGAYRLAEALKAAGGSPTLEIIPACGHRSTPAMEAARVKALDTLAGLLLG